MSPGRDVAVLSRFNCCTPITPAPYVGVVKAVGDLHGGAPYLSVTFKV